MISGHTVGGPRLASFEAGASPLGFAAPDYTIDDDIYNIPIDTLLDIPIDHYPHTSAVSIATAGDQVTSVSPGGSSRISGLAAGGSQVRAY